MAPSRVFADGALDGQVAIVTGGGTNLGKAAAAELARCGASVVIAGRRAEVLEAAAAEVGDRCSWVAGDIRERAGAELIVTTALERLGPARSRAEQRRRPVLGSGRGHRDQGLARRPAPQRGRHARDVRGGV